MSMTDLNALGLNWETGARKFPAAPALENDVSGTQSIVTVDALGDILHDKINAPKLLNTSLCRRL